MKIMKNKNACKIITIGTLKGGAGKTMNAFNIAGVLAEKKKVLLIDVDPQCNLTANCGIDITDRSAVTIKNIFEKKPNEDLDPEAIIIKSPIAALPKLDILPSSIFLFETDMKLWQRSDRERVLEKYFQKHRDFFDHYDYIIIDTNPSMSVININAFLIADNIILTTDVSKNSVVGAMLFCQLWDEKRAELDVEDNIAAMIISNYDGRSNMAKDLIEYVQGEDFSKDIILDNIIKSTVKLKETESYNEPINILYPRSSASDQYRAVVKELIKKEVF